MLSIHDQYSAEYLGWATSDFHSPPFPLSWSLSLVLHPANLSALTSSTNRACQTLPQFLVQESAQSDLISFVSCCLVIVILSVWYSILKKTTLFHMFCMFLFVFVIFVSGRMVNQVPVSPSWKWRFLIIFIYLFALCIFFLLVFMFHKGKENVFISFKSPIPTALTINLDSNN